MEEGSDVEPAPTELRLELEDGCQVAVKRGKVEPLTDNDLACLVEMLSCPIGFGGEARQQAPADADPTL